MMGCFRRGCCGDVGGGCFGGGRPLAALLPSPWDPLLISAWEGEGDGSRERGRLLWEGVLWAGVLFELGFLGFCGRFLGFGVGCWVVR